MSSAPEILSVVDTREFEEVSDGVFKPIAGSGDMRECDRCGRTHEVHATVRYPDGSIKVVGTGCMELGSAAARKAATKATTIARLRAELAAARARLEAATGAETAVLALPVPELTSSKHPTIADVDLLHCGEVSVWCAYGKKTNDPERRECAIREWRRQWELESGVTRNLYSIRQDVQDLEVRLARAGG